MIVLMVVGTGMIQALFFRHSIIEREAAIVRDIVYAATVDQGISTADMRRFGEPGPASLLDRSFRNPFQQDRPSWMCWSSALPRSSRPG
ncbi:MAG: hypothetical protein RL375_3811 [Pseudomonadota bacterium]|jgi:hypothetical protein